MSPPHLEVLLVGAYALFLLAAGGALEAAGGHAHRHAELRRRAGFTYHRHLDAWECPTGEQLWPKEVDHELRVIRYRAKAPVCNACPIKRDCTDADDGRELAVAIDPWPHSEAGRFHRGISLVLVVLAAAFLAIEATRHHDTGDLAALAAVAVVVAVVGLRAVRVFRASPANFPSTDGAGTLPPAVATATPAEGDGPPGSPRAGWATWPAVRPRRLSRRGRTRD